MNKEQINKTNTPEENKLRVFISHHSADEELARMFSDFLAEISFNMIIPFYSSDEKDGIAYGKDWFDKITNEIDNSSDVICLITAKSVEVPWILYEAGYASSSQQKKNVFCVAIDFDIAKCAGPFQRFQNCKYDVEHLIKLVIHLMHRTPTAQPTFDNKIIRTQVKTFYNKLAKYCSKRSKETNTKKEIQVNCPLKVENEVSNRKIGSVKDWVETSNDDDFSLLLLTSVFQKDITWLYEIGLETYQSLKKARTKTEKKKAIDILSQTIKNMEQIPTLNQLYELPDDFNKIIQKIKSILERYFYSLECPKCKVKNKVEAKFCRQCGTILK